MKHSYQILCTILLFFSTLSLSAQDWNIEGIILDGANLDPLIGATILVKGTDNGEATDIEGKFKLSVKKRAVLIISAVGYATQEIKVMNTKPLRVLLSPSITDLQEAVVVGYGMQKRGEITGSVASIDAKDLGNISALSFDNAIVGKAPGVLVQSSSGVPGSATSILIRGFSSLSNESNNPLIVVDGVPVFGTGKDLNNVAFRETAVAAASIGGNSVNDDFSNVQQDSEFERNPLAHLNPDDIESIEILKDAFSTAIYGSRGAAGVILITTKKGRTGKPRIDFSYNTGRSKPIDLPDLLSASEYAKVYSRYFEERGFPVQFPSEDSTDWVKEVIQPAWHQAVNLSISGGESKHQYYLGGSYLNQDSYVLNNGFERYSGKVNFANNSSNLFRYGTDISLSYTHNTALNAKRIFKEAVLRAPNVSVRDEDGNFIWNRGANPIGINENEPSNPLADALNDINELRDARTIGRIYAELQPVQWLIFKSQIGVDFLNSLAYSRRRARPGILSGGDAVESNTQNRRISIDHTLTFQKTWQSEHEVNAILGHSFEKSVENSLSVSGRDFFSNDILSISAADRVILNGALQREWALQSVFGRANYQFREKYLAGVTYRVDGSSQFARNNRYVHFPSFSVGWRASKETFLESTNWINNLMIRGSVGFSGNPGSGGGFYGNQGQFILNTTNSGGNLQYAGKTFIQTAQPSNPNLEWERSRVIDIGIDATILAERLRIAFDYYHKITNNLLYATSLPYYTGWTLQQQNIGKMRNSGWELLLESNQQFGDFLWSSTFNIATNSNKILELNFDREDPRGAASGYKYFAEGEPAGQFFLFDWVSVDAETGDPLWFNAEGELTTSPPGAEFETEIRDLSRRSYGSHLPDFFGGFDNTFYYQGFSLRTFFAFMLGGQIINGSRAQLLTYSLDDATNLSTEILNYWQTSGDETAIPRLANLSIRNPGFGITDYTTSRTSDRFLEDASYVRLKDVTLSYRLHGSMLAKIAPFSRLEIYLQATNLITITSYSGLDPEVSAFGSEALFGGYDELTMPQSKAIIFGVKARL